MRGNLNQDRLFQELQSLKLFLQELAAVTNKPPSPLDVSSKRRLKNLKALTKAGRAFYSKAGYAASVDYGWEVDDLDVPPPHSDGKLEPKSKSPSRWTESEPPDLSDREKKRIEDWRNAQPGFPPGTSVTLLGLICSMATYPWG